VAETHLSPLASCSLGKRVREAMNAHGWAQADFDPFAAGKAVIAMSARSVAA